MSKQAIDYRFLVRLAVLCLVVLLTPFAIGLAISQAIAGRTGDGGIEEPLEVVLPLEMQASIFHSLPIAGHMVTPDQIAQQVLKNPRSRATTGLPISGTGTAVPLEERGVVDALADPMD